MRHRVSNHIQLVSPTNWDVGGTSRGRTIHYLNPWRHPYHMNESCNALDRACFFLALSVILASTHHPTLDDMFICAQCTFLLNHILFNKIMGGMHDMMTHGPTHFLVPLIHAWITLKLEILLSQPPSIHTYWHPLEFLMNFGLSRLTKH